MENFMWSRYNFLLEIPEQGKFLYNSYSNSLISLEESLYREVKKLENDGLVTPEHLKKFSEEETDFLQRNCILVKDDEELIELMQHESMSRLYTRKHLVLTIAPTQTCNFACT